MFIRLKISKSNQNRNSFLALYIHEIIFVLLGIFYTFVLLFQKANEPKLLERWESGLIHRFAKPAYWETGTGGSNPPLSAGRPECGSEGERVEAGAD